MGCSSGKGVSWEEEESVHVQVSGSMAEERVTMMGLPPVYQGKVEGRARAICVFVVSCYKIVVSGECSRFAYL